MKLTWLGHSAFRIDIGAAKILIDPFLKGNPQFKLPFDQATAGVTHIVLTHGHDDHIGDAVEIAGTTGAQIVANFEICMYLSGQGVENINPGNTGGMIPCAGFAVALTPALHSASTVDEGKPIYLGNPNGVVILPEQGPRVHHFGDTAIYSDMALVHELYRPEIGLVPVGDRFTMDGATAALAVRRYFDFRDVIPMHYGTFPIIDATPDAFVANMAGASPRIHTPAIGETLSF
jgi:L-ascorbate metabolism protein UlaG (beta-lactamase superfamily)